VEESLLPTAQDPEAAPPREVALERRYSNLGELILAIARVGFRVLLFVRYLLIAGPARGDAPARVLVAAATVLGTVAFSGWTAARARRRGFGPTSHAVSATVDVALCGLVLLSNVVWPGPRYEGLVRTPDVAMLPVLVFASALRLTSPAVAASTLTALGSLLVLARIDGALNPGAAGHLTADTLMVAIVVVVAGTAAWFAAWMMRGALQRLARESEMVSRGRAYMRELLREHHDVRTLLGSARLHLDLLLEAQPTPEVKKRVSVAANAISAVAAVLDRIRQRTFGALATTDEIASVDVAGVLRDAGAVVRARFPAVAIDCAPPPAGAAPAVVAVLGGERGLAHVLLNLLVNACEGNGRGGAHRVDVAVGGDQTRPGFVTIDVVDDGPGFDAAILRAGPSGSFSTKADGSGLGLGLVAGVVEASGGELQLENRAA
jgi:signal transduction histidine kinase